MKKVLTLLALCVGLVELSAQAFTGTIEFGYVTQNDTSHNIYTVKNKLVRLDQYGKKGTVEGSYIFDFTANEIRWLNPKRKMWGLLKSETPQVVRGTCAVTKGTATKTVAGQKCIEYTVKNTEENTVITYWIAEGKFPFFAPLVKMWNKKDKQSIYFGQIKGLPEGSMPFLSEEKQLSDGKLLTKLEVTKATPGAPADGTFSVPGEYSKFD